MSTQTRQLAVIMFTDVVGFTTLMGKNEQKALSLLKTNRDIHKKTIKKHDGTWVKEIGDGTLGSFHTITDAVYCAGEIIQLSKEHEIKLRIGIHFGEVMEEDGDIFGDGVNVASRLEPLANPNQILVSDIIHKNIKNKGGIKSTFIEEKELKNVDEPVRIYSVEVDGDSENKNEEVFLKTSYSKKILISLLSIALIAVIIALFIFKPWVSNQSGSDTISTSEISNLDNKKTIAVLPFEDMSPEQDQEYLGDGIAEAIINRLVKVRGVKVIGRTSSFSFKGKDTDLKTIGKMLGVETILEGSVQKYGNQLRITVQLINTEDESHFWSEIYDREFSDILSMQDEISELVVDKMNADKTRLINSKGSYNENVNPEAYDLFLKGEFVSRRLMKTGKKEDYKLAENFFLQALSIDSSYATAHARLSDIYSLYAITNADLYGESNKTKEMLNLGKEHLEKAYALNPDSDLINALKAWSFLELEYSAVDSVYYYMKKALTINPNNPEILQWTASLYSTYLGLDKEAMEICNKVSDVDPLNIGVLYRVAISNLYIYSNFDKANNDLEEVLNLYPNHNISFIAFYLLNIQRENIQESQNYLDKYRELMQKDEGFAGLAPIYLQFMDSLINACVAKEGREKLLPYPENPLWKQMPPTIYISLGLEDKQLEFLEELVKNNPNKSYYLLLSKNPLLEPIRNRPRFQELLEINRIRHQKNIAKYGDLSFLNL